MKQLIMALVLLLLIVVQLFQTPAATILAQDFIDKNSSLLYDCPAKYDNYSTFGSRFESNLKNLLFPTLVLNGSPKSFFNTSSGVSPDTVYGLAQCRPDVSTKDCHDCLYISTLMIVQKCPQKVDAAIRFERCMLRYSNIRFFSTMNTSDLRYTDWYWENNESSNITDDLQAVFNQQFGVLFANLTSVASSLPSKFMTGSIRYNDDDDFSKIYGLVDCTQDLSSEDCLFCLQAMLNKLPAACPVGKKGGFVLSRSCGIWYRNFQFFQLLPPPQPRITTTISGSSLPNTDIRMEMNEGLSVLEWIYNKAGWIIIIINMILLIFIMILVI